VEQINGILTRSATPGKIVYDDETTESLLYVKDDSSLPPPPPPPPPNEWCEWPNDDDPAHWKAWEPSEKPTQYWPQMQAALNLVGDTCGMHPMAALRLIAAELTEMEVCASVPGDHVSIKRESDDMYEEWHNVYFGNGCIIQNGQRSHKATYEYLR